MTDREASILTKISTMTEERLLRLLPTFSDNHLEWLADFLDADGSACGCPRVPLPCECGHVTYGIARVWELGDRQVGDLRATHRVLPRNFPKEDDPQPVTHDPQPCKVCGMEPDYAPCPHFGKRPHTVLLREAIHDILSRERPRPETPTRALEKEALIQIYGEREDAGEALFHPRDAIQQDPTHAYLDAIETPIFTRHGWRKAGEPEDIPEPLRNGDTVAGRPRRRRGNHGRAA